MWVQAAGLFLTVATRDFEWWLAGSLLLGLGTAMVYPSLIAAVSDASHPIWRARSLSVCRFWRDLGYAIGALSAGIIADRFGLSAVIQLDRPSDVYLRRRRRGVHARTPQVRLNSRKKPADPRSRVGFFR
jgi:MFS family permease